MNDYDSSNLSLRAASDSRRRYIIEDSSNAETKLLGTPNDKSDDSKSLSPQKRSPSPGRQSTKHTSKDTSSAKSRDKKNTKISKIQHEKLPKSQHPRPQPESASNPNKTPTKLSEISSNTPHLNSSTSSDSQTISRTADVIDKKKEFVSSQTMPDVAVPKRRIQRNQRGVSPSTKRRSTPISERRHTELLSAAPLDTIKLQTSLRNSLSYESVPPLGVSKTTEHKSTPYNEANKVPNVNNCNSLAQDMPTDREIRPMNSESNETESRRQPPPTHTLRLSTHQNELLEETEEDQKTMQRLKSQRDIFIRQMSYCNLDIDPSGVAVVSHVSSSSESSDENDTFDWDHANETLTKEIAGQGNPLPEEAKLVSNLALLVKAPTWRNEEWIDDLEKQKAKEKRVTISTVSASSSNSTLKSEIEKSEQKPHSASQATTTSKPLVVISNRRQGMVLQKGPRGRWKRRWMKLEGGKLFIFKNDINAKEPKHIVPLLFSQCKPVGQHDKLFVFELFTPEKKFSLATRTSSEMNNWVSTIQASCDDQMLQSLDRNSSNSVDSGDKVVLLVSSKMCCTQQHIILRSVQLLTHVVP
jgi:hypothetical protein